MSSLSTTFSSADEFSPLQPIFPNLSTSEEMSVLIARIAEMNRANTVEPSIACSDNLFGQDGNGSEDDEFSPADYEDGQKKEKREKPTNEAVEERFSQLQNDQKKLLEKICELEKQQKQQQNENTTKAGEERFSQLQNDRKKLLEKISEMKKQQKEQAKATAVQSDQFSKIMEKITEMEKQQKQQHEITIKASDEKVSQSQNDQKEFLEKIYELEKQQKEKSKATEDQFSKLFEKISELEKQQKQQHEHMTKAILYQFSKMQNDHKILFEKISEMEKEQKPLQKENTERFSQLQNDRKKLLEKISEMEKQQKEQSKVTGDQLSKIQNNQEKEQKQRKALLIFRQNYWDANVCDEKLEIIGHKNLIVHYKGHAFGWCSVFAIHPILLNNNSSDIFYYEISIHNKKNWMSFGFAVKQQNKLDGTIRSRKGTYAYESDGCVWNNGERKRINAQYSYGEGDTVGIGFNSATRQIIFTKNGLRLDSADFFVDPYLANDSLYPFVTLCSSGDKIEANFGPNLKFGLSTL
ncbi:hypothetical protein niasHS_008594 [Heterodera schachtii]|uniref:B30.2/SPRY domain-containing protein n=1 Tax=Heterodera schachtii TaxID=97005 RepID=A0ABD2J8A8_HETSC